jgi:hypothetical protein
VEGRRSESGRASEEGIVGWRSIGGLMQQKLESSACHDVDADEQRKVDDGCKARSHVCRWGADWTQTS